MEFEPGQSGNPAGRPKGSYGGRIQALAGLDKLLARKKNQKALIEALEKELQANPVRFFRTVIMPLLPRESKLSFDHDGVVQWKSLLGAGAESVSSEQLSVNSTRGDVHGGDSRTDGAVLDVTDGPDRG